jgi:cbb3-type cytochrome oxidase maturation protein
MMNEPTIALTLTSLAVFLVFTGLFVWGLITGQFKDVEAPKYKMLEQYDAEHKSKGVDKDA